MLEVVFDCRVQQRTEARVVGILKLDLTGDVFRLVLARAGEKRLKRRRLLWHHFWFAPQPLYSHTMLFVMVYSF